MLTRWSTLVVFLFLLNQLQAQTTDEKFYVVVGAFKVKQNAINLTNKLHDSNEQATWKLNTNRQLYYVYIFESVESKKAYAKALYTRLNTSYKDTWVFKGKFETELPTQTEQEPIVIKEKISKEMDTLVQQANNQLKETLAKPKGKPFRFVFRNISNAELVNGKVVLLENTKAIEQEIYNSNEIVYLETPNNRSKSYLIVTQAPGYIEESFQLDFLQPVKSGGKIDSTGVFVFELNLEKVKLGDYIEFHHLSFFNNTAIFKPESQAELDGLAEMLKDNPKYKIAIHAHCNGKERRDIVSRGKSVDFFMPHADNHKEHGSAKRLTELMGEAVKDYLITQGIEGNRIKVKPEGAIFMIYPQNNSRADKNNRIEIEVTRGK